MMTHFTKLTQIPKSKKLSNTFIKRCLANWLINEPYFQQARPGSNVKQFSSSHMWVVFALYI